MSDPSQRPAQHRSRLVYFTHPDAAVGKVICDSFIERRFHLAMLPDAAAMARLVSIRRPDLVLMPLGDTAADLDETFRLLDTIRGLHLGIATFLLAPERTRAQVVTAAVKRGAGEVFSPPYSALDIVTTAEKVLGADGAATAGPDHEAPAALKGFGMLTYREQQILQLIVEGRTNKEIAIEFGLSHRTVEVHRRNVLKKTGARNTAELVRMALER